MPVVFMGMSIYIKDLSMNMVLFIFENNNLITELAILMRLEFSTYFNELAFVQGQ